MGFVLQEPGRLHTQTFLIDLLSGSEPSVCLHDHMLTDTIPVQPRMTLCVEAFAGADSQILQKCFIDKEKESCGMSACVCVRLQRCGTL